jgi:hypothetical protein
MRATESARSKIARNFYRLFNESGYIITRAEHISRSTRIVRSLAPYNQRLQAPLSPSHKWAVWTIATNDAPRELLGRPNMAARFGADRGSVEQLPRSNRMAPKADALAPTS